METIYRAYQIWIKPNHRMYSYFQTICQNAKRLYNTSNFYIRQVYTALTKDKPLQPLQQEVMNAIYGNIGKMNEIQVKANKKRLKRQPSTEPLLFHLPTKEKPFVGYRFLDALFKAMDQPDYRSLPAQVNQEVIKAVYANWKSFFTAIKDYKEHPEKYKERPGIPKYIRSQEKEVVLTNQVCEIKDGKYLKFPLTKKRINIGKLGVTDGALKQVRIIPRYGHYVVEVVMEHPISVTKTGAEDRYMSIDLGIDNLATIVTNTGIPPILVKGKHVKSINQYYNKRKAYYTAILRRGKKPEEGPYTSKRLERLNRIRHLKIKDIFHKVSYHIVQLAIKQNIGTIIIGQNKGWKQEVKMGKRNNQSFSHIPHSQLISMIEYKARKYGIRVILTEESYTSKASFLDRDPIPEYEEGKKYTFSGKRISRGLYRSAQNIIINADVNGSANIMRKVVPNAFANGIEGLDGNQSVNVSTPQVLSVR